MDNYTMTEQAYKNGYEQGLKDGRADSISVSPVCVLCDGKTEEGCRTEACGYLTGNLDKCMEQARHLSELAQAEKESRLVVLPCKVGDTVYKIDTDPLLDSREILELTVDNFVVCEDGEILVKYDSWDGVICTADNLVNGTAYLDYYRTFLTREEAEAALQKG